MKRLSVLVIGLSVFAVGCGSSSPSSPSQQNTTTSDTYTVTLSPANEVPPVANADAGSSGTATIVLTATKDDSGAVRSATMNFQISVTGLPAGTTVTKAHIHNGMPGANAGIFVDTGLSSGEMALVNGSGSIAKNGINVPPDTAAAIIRNPGAHYFNVHTVLNPDGAIRGQLSASR